MDNINMEQTTSTPAVKFSTNGRLLIEGHSLPENVLRFYDPLIAWSRLLKAESVKIDINLEDRNRASSKKLLELLKVLDANSSVKSFMVDWHYESDDEDALESGQIFEEMLRKAEFRYLEYSESV